MPLADSDHFQRLDPCLVVGETERSVRVTERLRQLLVLLRRERENAIEVPNRFVALVVARRLRVILPQCHKSTEAVLHHRERQMRVRVRKKVRCYERN